ncbi:MAG: hypothetical protein Q9M50_14275 [Methylococcales bacterium]|nr:hypothetical protein [Methylococcales bacterium]
MDKLTFVQNIVIRSMPEPGKLAAAITYAEAAWQQLSERGYGEKKNAISNPKADSYHALSERQRFFFDEFWRAFDYKKDRANAVKRFAQLGDLDDLHYQQIIEAARKEAARDFGNLSRKMAQGWLADKRYLDDYSNGNATHQYQPRKLSAVERVKQANGF